MSLVRIRVADLAFTARFEEESAPQTCAAFRSVLPFRSQLIQARWSGEAGWIPLGDFELKLRTEHATSHPSRGDILFYPAGASECEILFPHGSCVFASKVGQLAGNHFLTLTSGMEQLPEMGRRILWEGAQPIEFTLIE
jgi:hypothetical protein